MKIQEVKEKAKMLGLETFGINKDDLIRNIQSREGNIPCFKTGIYSCDQFICCWRSDCLPAQEPLESMR